MGNHELCIEGGREAGMFYEGVRGKEIEVMCGEGKGL